MNIPNALRKKRLVILYILVVAVLTMVSIYNAYSVIISYLYDNVSTKVQIKIAYNIIPFAAYFTVSLSLLPQSTWYPETWSMNDSTVYDLLPGFNVISLHRLANRKNENSFSFSNARNELESLIDIAQMSCAANSLDYRFIWANKNDSTTLARNDARPPLGDDWLTPHANFTDPSDFIGEQASLCTLAPWSQYPKLKASFMSSLDSFIANQYGPKLIDQALDRIMNFNYSRYDSDETRFFSDPPQVRFVVDEFRLGHLSVSFPFDTFSNRSAYGRPIEVYVYPTDFNAVPSPILTDVKAVFSPVAAIDTGFGRADLAVPFDEFSIFPHPTVLNIKVKIRNHAIYNSTDVHSDQYCKRCGNLTDVDDCVFKCYVDAVVDGCECIPFTFRRLYPNDPTKNTLQLCTGQIYKSCFQAGNYNPGHCTRENCVPCITQRNYIEMTITKEKLDYNTSYPSPRYRLKFEFSGDDKTYAVFQDIYQNSWMGMLGQLGGNLGIFLGFSLLGIWQFIVYVFVYVQRKRKIKMIKKQQNQPQGFLVSWLRLAQITLETSANQQEQNRDDDDELKKENEMLRLDVIKLQTVVDKQSSTIAVLENRLERLEKTSRRTRKTSSTDEESHL